jgi:hypothetical protein
MAFIFHSFILYLSSTPAHDICSHGYGNSHDIHLLGKRLALNPPRAGKGLISYALFNLFPFAICPDVQRLCGSSAMFFVGPFGNHHLLYLLDFAWLWSTVMVILSQFYSN